MRKQTRRRLAALALSAALLGAALPLSAQAATFRDVPAGAWYADAVYDLSYRDILQGTSSTTFSPGEKLTRGAFALMMARTVLTASELAQYQYRDSFSDVPASHWANAAVNWASEAGVVQGVGGGRFQPDQPLSRQDMAVMVVNFANAMGRDMPGLVDSASFRDSGQIAAYAKNSVAACQRSGVIDGYEDGTYRPNGTATRAEAAALYSRFLENCPAGEFTILRKRVNSVPVRAVEFDPYTLTAGLALGGDRVKGAESPTSLVQRTGAKVAVNAAFFNMNSYLPIGTLISEGRVLTSDNTYAPAKSAFVMDSVGNFSIKNFSTLHTATLHKGDGTTSVIKSIVVNRQPSGATDAARILFTRDWGATLGFPARDAIVVDSTGTITQVAHYQDVAIPQGGYVLAQRSRRQYEGDFFDSCQVGLTVDMAREYRGADRDDLVLSIGAGPRIVKDGAVYGDASTYRAEGFGDAAFTSYNAVRAAIGIQADGSLLILTANTSLPKLSQIMVSLGCVDAINFDGGGSTNLYVDGQWLYGPQERLLNTLLYFK